MSLGRCLCLLLGLVAARANASLTVLVGEPFGNFGTMMPNGHIAIYLDRVCADGPLKVRMCTRRRARRRRHRAPRQPSARSTGSPHPSCPSFTPPAIPARILTTTTPDNVLALREQYRAANLESLLPDGAEHRKANSDWWEMAGAAYSRRLWGYQVDTTRAQDEAFVAMLNARTNTHVYAVRTRNCADFAAEIVNFYYPEPSTATTSPTSAS